MGDAQNLSDEDAAAGKPAPPPAAATTGEGTPPPSQALWIEVAVVLLMAVLPDVFYAFSVDWWPDMPRTRPFMFTALFLVVRTSQASALVLYLIWRRPEPWSHFGIVRVNWVIDLFFAIGVWFASFVAWHLFWFALRFFGPKAYAILILDNRASTFFTRPEGAIEYSLLFLVCFANAFGEELVMRAYLIPRFERLFESTWKALLLSSLLFAAYHVYQGTVGVLGALLGGLVYGGAFCLLRRLWPIVIAHAVHNVTAWLGAWL